MCSNYAREGRKCLDYMGFDLNGPDPTHKEERVWLIALQLLFFHYTVWGGTNGVAVTSHMTTNCDAYSGSYGWVDTPEYL